mmetsp:Transcript_24137/g.62978  ORF Transcript_24137/g.62978 Transcript_24137/m.62978 type:complete len:520 (+) Transcript_24137:113-1672(+)
MALLTLRSSFLRRSVAGAAAATPAQQTRVQALRALCSNLQPPPHNVERHPEVPWRGGPTAYGPAFAVEGSKIQVLETPAQFYSTLLEGITRADRRVTLASLYLGTGPKEVALADAVAGAVRANPALKVQLLVDHTRGTRGDPNSACLLRRVLSAAAAVAAPDVAAAMYLTPRLTTMLRRVLPPPIDEVIELTHAKVYLWDDTVLLTGANLSDQYFTDRQDRYVLVESRELADFLVRYVGSISTLSSRLLLDGIAESPLRGDLAAFKVEVHRLFNDLLAASPSAPGLSHFLGEIVRPVEPRGDGSAARVFDTVICPLIQAGSWGVRHDEAATVELVGRLPQGSTAWMATGYFNLPAQLAEALVGRCGARINILTAAPAANGFLGARGLLGHIPAAYTHIAAAFLALLRRRGQEGRVKLYEYARTGYTFHAKGIWGYGVGEEHPSYTLVGSPNFGERSANRDHECQLAVFTANVALRESLHRERTRLFSSAQQVTVEDLTTPGRKAASWVSFVTQFIRPFF